MTAEELRDRLGVIEPTEDMYRGIEEGDVPALEQLLGDGEPWLAARAVYALARVESPRAAAAVAEAAGDRRPEVRVAAAVNAPRLPGDHHAGILERLLADDDVGVRKFAIRGVSTEVAPRLRARLEDIARADPHDALRALATERLEATG